MGELMAAQTPSTQIRRITSLFAGAFILSGLASMGCAAAESAWTPDRTVIEEIEHTVSLPAETMNYLVLLAERGKLGPSEQDVAAVAGEFNQFFASARRAIDQLRAGAGGFLDHRDLWWRETYG